MLIDILSGFMQTCPHPLKQHFSEPEQSSSPWQQASTQMPIWSGLGLGQNLAFPSVAANFNITFMVIFCYSVLAERFSSLSSSLSSLFLSLSLSISFHEILIMQVVTIGVTLNKNKPASFAQ